MRVLRTGGAGFIGLHLTGLLLNNGYGGTDELGTTIDHATAELETRGSVA
jgi:nucleoside-diphosphate-sugar epimerase